MPARATRVTRRPTWRPTLALLSALNLRLICNGLAPPHDDPRHLERLLSGGVTWPGRAVDATVRRWHVGSIMWLVRVSPVGPRLYALWKKLHMRQW